VTLPGRGRRTATATTTIALPTTSSARVEVGDLAATLAARTPALRHARIDRATIAVSVRADAPIVLEVDPAQSPAPRMLSRKAPVKRHPASAATERAHPSPPPVPTYCVGARGPLQTCHAHHVGPYGS